MLLAGNIKLGCELNVTSVPLNVSSTNTVLTSNTVCWFWMEADDGVVDWLCPKFLVVFNIVGVSGGQTSFLNYRLHALITGVVLLVLNKLVIYFIHNKNVPAFLSLKTHVYLSLAL